MLSEAMELLKDQKAAADWSPSAGKTFAAGNTLILLIRDSLGTTENASLIGFSKGPMKCRK